MPRDLLLAHDRMPLASKSAGERVGEDSDHSGRVLSAHRCIQPGISLCLLMKTTSASGQAARTSAAYSLVTFLGVLTSTGSAWDRPPLAG